MLFRSMVSKQLRFQDDSRSYCVNSTRISCISGDNHSSGDSSFLYERQIATIRAAESSPSRLNASLLSLTAYKELNQWSDKSIKLLYTWIVWTMIRATVAAFCNSADGAYDAASCTRLMMSPEACNVTSLKFESWPERLIARFELSPIAIVIVERVGRWSFSPELWSTMAF